MHIKLLTRIVTLVLGMFLMLAPLAAWAAPAADLPTAVVNTGRLNVRSGPGVAFGILTRVGRGETLTLLGRNSAGSWVNVKIGSGIVGWVNAAYIVPAVAISSLPVSDMTQLSAPGMVTAAQLELRSGPSTVNSVLAVLSRGQSLMLLGRTDDSAWLKVQAGAIGEGWIVAQVIVRLPGAENGVATPTIQSDVDINSLPVVSGMVGGVGPATPPGPEVSLSSVSARPATPVIITVQGFPPNQNIAAVLTSPLVPLGVMVATGNTDAAGSAQLFFRMPDTWPGGAAIVETHLSLAVGTTDGAVLIWNGIDYHS